MDIKLVDGETIVAVTQYIDQLVIATSFRVFKETNHGWVEIFSGK